MQQGRYAPRPNLRRRYKYLMFQSTDRQLLELNETKGKKALIPSVHLNLMMDPQPKKIQNKSMGLFLLWVSDVF